MASTNCKEEREAPDQKQGSGKIYSKMLSKQEESAAATLAVPSFRVYYGVASAGSVPFLWESQPGTPKRSSTSAATLPPLTPPPSYYAAGRRGAKKGGGGTSGKRWPGGVISAIWLRRPGRRTSPCSSSSSSSWSSSPTASSMSPVFTVHSSPAARGGAIAAAAGHRRAFSASDDVIINSEELPAARCFGFGMERQCGRAMVKGCGIAVAVRNALANVVGRKSGRRATSAAA